MFGIAALETLLAAPAVLLLGLSALQWGLVFHGYQAVSHAAQQGARAGSVGHASIEAIERGFAQGLLPWLFGSSGPLDHAVNLERARRELDRGRSAGWVIWRQLSPAKESFEDWSAQATDAWGEPIPEAREIPNDNLNVTGGSVLPASGISGYRDGEPIGTASGQTLADANFLKLEFTYGVPLTVPLVGRFSAWVMSRVDGCASRTSSMRLGALEFGSSAIEDPPGGDQRAPGRGWTCVFYEAKDSQGGARPRWPVRVSATIRMQSPARMGGAETTVDNSPRSGEALGAGSVAPAPGFAPMPVERINPGGAGPTEDGSIDRAPGFLRLGGDRLVELPGVCVGS